MYCYCATYTLRLPGKAVARGGSLGSEEPPPPPDKKRFTKCTTSSVQCTKRSTRMYKKVNYYSLLDQ